jgi:signal transduction histidine kinase
VLNANVYRNSILLGVLVTLTLLVTDLIFNVVNPVIYAYPITAFILLLFYFFNKKNDKSKFQYIALSVLLFIIIDLAWLLGDGSTIINILVYFLFIIYTLIIIPPKYINYWTLFIFVNFMVVIFLELKLSIPLNYFDVQPDKMIFIIGYFLAVIASTMILLLFFRARFDSERVVLQNRTNEINEIRRFFKDQNTQIESYIKDIEKLNKSIDHKNLELEEQQKKITEATNNLERKVKQKTKRLETRVSEQDAIFYQSSHDFRRPLASLLGLKEVSRLINNEESKNLLELVGDTATEMDAMLGKFLTLYNINHYREKTERIEIEKILNVLSRRVDKQGGTLEIINSCSDAGRVSPRNVLLKPILDNLVENSLFYKKPNETVRVRIELLQSDGECKICVTDYGLGIPEEYHDKVFGIYFKGSSISKGNGLGLYVVRKAIEALDGTVTLESEKGEFTKITILYKEEKD